MMNVSEFRGFARIYSVLWLVYCVLTSRNTVRFGDARQIEIDSMIDDWAFMKKCCKNPALIPFLFIFTWTLSTLIDVLGIVLLIQFADGVVFRAMLALAAIFFLGMIIRSSVLFSSLNYISDTESLRAALEKSLTHWKVRCIAGARIARMIEAVTFVYILYS